MAQLILCVLVSASSSLILTAIMLKGCWDLMVEKTAKHDKALADMIFEYVKGYVEKTRS